MPKYFTYLWKNVEWERKRKEASPALTYAASDLFTARGVHPGATLYIITVMGGELFLGGTIVIHRVLTKSDASSYLSVPEAELWQAGEYAVAEISSASSFYHNLRIEERTALNLEFSDGRGGFRNPRVKDGRLDQQTFRGIRQLYGTSHLELSRILATAL